MEQGNGKIDLKLMEYNFDSSLPTMIREISCKKNRKFKNKSWNEFQFEFSLYPFN